MPDYLQVAIRPREGRVSVGGVLTMGLAGQAYLPFSGRSSIRLALDTTYLSRQMARKGWQAVPSLRQLALSLAGVDSLVEEPSAPSFLDEMYSEEASASYDTSPIVALSRLGVPLPALSWKVGVTSRAREILDSLPDRRFSMTYRSPHPISDVERDSHAAMWADALEDIWQIHGYRPVVLGSVEESRRISAGKFADVAQDAGLAVRMAVGALTPFHLGDASGLASEAIFSKRPYTLFKHPREHPAEMKRELSAEGRLPFAVDRQVIRRVQATRALILNEFESLARDPNG